MSSIRVFFFFSSFSFLLGCRLCILACCPRSPPVSSSSSSLCNSLFVPFLALLWPFFCFVQRMLSITNSLPLPASSITAASLTPVARLLPVALPAPCRPPPPSRVPWFLFLFLFLLLLSSSPPAAAVAALAHPYPRPLLLDALLRAGQFCISASSFGFPSASRSF